MLVLSVSAQEQAFERFVIEDIRVEGLDRLDTGIVFRNLELSIGDEFDRRSAGAAIRRLFATGVFRDVQLRRDGNVLVVEIVENPTISEIGISGMDEFDPDDVLEQLEELDFSKSAILRPDTVERVVQFIKSAYTERAYFAVSIVPTVTPLDRNRVRVDLEILEGGIVRISAVDIYGVESEDVDDVLDQMELGSTNWLSWYKSDDVYSAAVFQGDIGRIQDYYLERGYLKFNVVSSEVILSRNQDSIRLVIVIEEGGTYSLSGWDYSGDPVVDSDGLNETLDLVTGETYSAKKVEAAAEKIRKHLGNRSFAKAKVLVNRILDEESNQVKIDFNVSKGDSIYVRRINISGNQKTRDEVIRRELRQFEGDLYSTEKIDRSRRKLERLGFFDNVVFEEQDVPGDSSQVDLLLDVEESTQGTGSVGLGVGYSRSGGVSFSGSLRTENIFGTGNDFETEVSFSDTVDSFSIEFDQPYVTAEGVSRHIGLSRREVESDDDVSDYSLEGSGLDYGYGIPFDEETILFANIHYVSDSLVNVGQVSEVDTEAQEYLTKHGTKTTTYSASASLTRDTRDSTVSPSTGFRQNFTTRVTLPFGDLRYYSMRFLHDHYFPVGDKYVAELLGELSYADSYGGYVYPFFRRYHLGGPASLRGYDAGTIGRKDEDGDSLGGRLRMRGSAEFYFPFPVLSEFDGVRTSFFTDIGGLYSDPSDFDLGELRASAGLTIRWLSPLGPFRFILAQPLRSKDGDKTRSFDFTIGVF